ncbi:ISP domain-containing protein, partial [Aureobasidium melanogenum]
MASFLSYFNRRDSGNTTKPALDKQPVRALPASWYTSPDMYELERRAIFSRRWLLITHKLRLTKPGDFLRYDVAGFQFVLAKDRQENINGFHNICRHRAYPVVEKQEGTARIFACRYHGWSYGLNGKLAKAPSYQELEGFDKEANGLLPVHVHVDRNGFVWVNMDAKAEPEIAWEDNFDGVDVQSRYDSINFENYVFDHKWEMDGPYNWKILADNYNECYHCPTTHPDIPALADLEAYHVNTTANHIQHEVASTPEQVATGMTVIPTYYFPNASVNATPHFFFMQRFVPHGPGKATMSYEVYRNKNASDEDFEKINQMYKRIMSEDKVLCDAAQKNVNAGVFVNGLMHPRMEKGPLYFQKLCREAVTEHHDKEKAAGAKIHPARQQMSAADLQSEKDIEFCSGLACGEEQQEALAW